ncbi:MAG: DNA polymerase III subunit delta [Paludibacteraceae bacterium]|nr:DNA polymerase III subunit delta [Paludibacteraceae bacterium]
MAKKEGLKFADVYDELVKGAVKPIYLLHGEEPYFIDKISDYIEQNLVGEDAKDFDLKVIYGSDCTMGEVVIQAMSYPFCGDRNVVIVKEAQNLKGFDALTEYAKHPNPQSVLVLCYKYKKVDARKAYVNEVTKSGGVVFYSAKPYENELPKYIQNIVAELGHQIEPKATELLISYVGANLQSIENELKKVTNSLTSKTTVTYDMVAKGVGISKEFNAYELLDAVRNKDASKANLIALKIGGDKVQIEPIVATFYTFFSKLCIYHKYFKNGVPNDFDVMKVLGLTSTFFSKQYISGAHNYNVFQAIKAIDILRKADERSKGLGISPLTTKSEILQEMIYNIMHCKGVNDPF